MSSSVVSTKNEEISIQPTHFSKKKIEEILRKYPDRIPIVISSKSFKSHDINRFIVPVDMTINQFMLILRNKTKLKEMEAIFIFVKDGNSKNKDNTNEIIAPVSETLGSLYDKYKDEKLVLNLFYEKEAVFG
jgi:GABA(A) receptor-associated protein